MAHGNLPHTAQSDRGRTANSPGEIPPKGLWDVAWRVWDGFNHDRLLLVAAGASFYLVLALFPAMAAFVSLYGLVADRSTIVDHMVFLDSILPSDGWALVNGQLSVLAAQKNDTLGLAFAISFVVAFWSANSGIKSLFEGLNIAYSESEKRGVIKLNSISLAFTACAMVGAIVVILALGIVPAVLSLMYLEKWSEVLIRVSRWPVLLALVALALSILYRFGPSREDAKWKWISWGAALATAIWFIAALGLSWYLENFANYNATYGSLGAMVGFMIWTWVSVAILLVGAKMNAELEHQTIVDSTTGAPLPLGQRGAVMADTVGQAAPKL